MARYDKYEPFAGGFRASLAADFAYTASLPDRAHVDLNKPFGVGLDANGLVVKGVGVTGIKGLLVLNIPKSAGDAVDIMCNGEVLEWMTSAGVAGVAGMNYYAANASGIVAPGTTAGGVTPPATSVYLGFTAEVTTTKGARFIARVGTRPVTAV